MVRQGNPTAVVALAAQKGVHAMKSLPVAAALACGDEHPIDELRRIGEEAGESGQCGAGEHVDQRRTTRSGCRDDIGESIAVDVRAVKLRAKQIAAFGSNNVSPV